MRLHSLNIKGFRKHIDTTVLFSDSTFLIGENNVGKSSILFALEYLLGAYSKIPKEEYYTFEEQGVKTTLQDSIVLEAEFRNIPKDAENWRGFKGRLLKYEKHENEGDETGLKFVYRKTFPLDGKVIIETLEYSKKIKSEFDNCDTIQKYIDAGLPEELIPEELAKMDRVKKLTAKSKEILSGVEELYDYTEIEKKWVENPGGIPQNVLCKLPRYLLIPAQDSEDEISGTSGTLQKALNELFSEVRDKSENYKQAQHYLDLLAKELDCSNDKTEISKMISDLNKIVSEVFPSAGISANVNLSDANSVIKPSFDINMSSNISTSSKLQGTGLIRSTVFALLRYKALKDNEKDNGEGRQLIIGFEEPEIYLHPNAISKMRDTVYSLAGSGKNQIICTTHSPYMIDLSKKPKQILNCFSESFISDSAIDNDGKSNYLSVVNKPFNITKEFKALQKNEKDYIKMLLRVEDGIAKCFFVKNVLIVEGDTEQVVLSKSISLLPEDLRSQVLSEWYILRARGKAVIIPIIKYLKAMQISIHVMHDEDSKVDGASKFNDPIREALNNDNRLHVLKDCIEDVLGYNVPKSDKPYEAFRFMEEHWNNYYCIGQEWRKIIERLFNDGEEINSLAE